jgi:hypothetical protein
MRHLRDVAITIVAVVTMYLVAGRLTPAIYDLLPDDVSLTILLWTDRLVLFGLGAIVGAVLMRILRWRARMFVMLIPPLICAIALPLVAYHQLLRQYPDAVPYSPFLNAHFYLAIPVLGMLCGALLIESRTMMQTLQRRLTTRWSGP